jgi:hypothetical protein
LWCDTLRRVAPARHPRRDRAARRRGSRLAARRRRAGLGALDAGAAGRRARLHGDRRQATLGPLAESLGFTVKTFTYRLEHEVRRLAGLNGVMYGGASDGRPAMDTDVKMAETILSLSGTTNGELAVQGFRTLEQRVGKPLADLAGAVPASWVCAGPRGPASFEGVGNGSKNGRCSWAWRA